jgi:hypothetical protein
LGTIGGNADQDSGIRLEVSNKNVGFIISVIGDEVAGTGVEGDIAAVAAYTRIPADTGILGTIGGNADQGSGIRLEVSNKNVRGIISVTGDEVAGK